LLRELLLHDAAGKTAFVSLVVSQERQDHLSNIMQQVNKPPLPRSEDFHCKLCDFPLTNPQNPRHQSLMNLGQGARGYCISTEFAKFVLAQRVWSWYDVFLHATAVKFQRQHGGDRRLMFLWPPMATHPVQHSDCARGSDRMLAHLPNAAARVADYVTIDFKQQWGCSNRLESIALLLMVCHATNTGLHVKWEAAECCPGQLSELIHLEADQSELSGIPFIQVHTLSGHFRAFCNRSVMPQNKGNFSFQLPVRLFTEAARDILSRGSNKNPTFQDATQIDWGAAWRALRPRRHIMDDVDNFLHRWGDSWHHVAFHVRRGDWRRREECNAAKQHGEAGAERVKKQYDDADWAILALDKLQSCLCRLCSLWLVKQLFCLKPEQPLEVCMFVSRIPKGSGQTASRREPAAGCSHPHRRSELRALVQEAVRCRDGGTPAEGHPRTARGA
jgi:hypothetical protein